MKYEFGTGIAEAQAQSGKVVATVDALHWQENDQWRSLRWHQIARATWSTETALFRVEPVEGAALEWLLTKAGRLPEAARERITSTIIAQDLLNVPGHGKVAVIFRQADGQVLVQLAPPIDPALVSEQIRRVQGELGIG